MTDTPRATWGGLVAGARAERPTFAQAAPTHTAAYGPRECAGCAFHQNQRRLADERYDNAQAKVTALEVENTALRAQVNGTAVTRTAADFAALERRMHRLAGEEADARGELADKTNELQRALADMDRAERTAENLRVRMLAAGIVP
jgi:multidrug resistance efflux pump